MKRIKKALCLFGAVVALVCFSAPVSAAETSAGQSGMIDDYYNQQFEESGAADLPDALPEETRQQLEDLGVGDANWMDIQNITPQGFLGVIVSIAGESSIQPLKSAVSVIAVMLLCALLNGMRLSFGERTMGNVIGMVGTLCVCTIIISPVVSCIQNAAFVIKAAAGFLLACIPVLTGIMIAAGQTVSAGSYNLIMVGAGNAISLLAANVLVPLMNIFLAVSVVSSVSPNLNLSGLCQSFSKVTKWILGFCMTVFSGLLTLHGLVGSALDSTSARAARFVVSSFVPVVGSALGEALQTINGCVKMLKSGVSAFGLLAGIIVFLPAILQCLLWQITLYLCAGIGDIFDLKEITSLLRAAANTISTMLAITICCMAVLTVSTVAMLIIGGGGGQ